MIQLFKTICESFIFRALFERIRCNQFKYLSIGRRYRAFGADIIRRMDHFHWISKTNAGQLEEERAINPCSSKEKTKQEIWGVSHRTSLRFCYLNKKIFFTTHFVRNTLGILRIGLFQKVIINLVYQLNFHFRGSRHYQYVQEDESVYHSKRHQVLVSIIVEKDPTLDMHLSTKRESYSLEVSRVVNTMEPRDNVQITIRY